MGMRPVRPLVCERVRGQISVGLDGELSQLERAMIASHVERCATCREYQGEVSCFTQVIREAPLEPMARAITIPRRRRHVGTRVQVAAAAAVAVAALAGASQALRSQQLNLDPTFVPAGSLHINYQTREQVEREQAILARARPGHPVQLQGKAL
jgi:predicted anti-sigma-YlaC factor YlaD